MTKTIVLQLESRHKIEQKQPTYKRVPLNFGDSQIVLVNLESAIFAHRLLHTVQYVVSRSTYGASSTYMTVSSPRYGTTRKRKQLKICMHRFFMRAAKTVFVALSFHSSAD